MNGIKVNDIIIGLAKKHLQELKSFLKVVKVRGMKHSEIELKREIRKLTNHIKKLEEGAKNAVS